MKDMLPKLRWKKCGFLSHASRFNGWDLYASKMQKGGWYLCWGRHEMQYDGFLCDGFYQAKKEARKVATAMKDPKFIKRYFSQKEDFECSPLAPIAATR
jgi:hypothetical protein